MRNDHSHPHPHEPAWKHDGVRVVKANQLDSNTAQTPGMDPKPRLTLHAWARKSCEPARSPFTPMPKPAHTTTVIWKA